MACLDIDPGFRNVTTVPQLSTPYIHTPDARVHVPLNTRHTYIYTRAQACTHVWGLRGSCTQRRAYLSTLFHPERRMEHYAYIRVRACGLRTRSITGDSLEKVVLFPLLKHSEHFVAPVSVNRIYELRDWASIIAYALPPCHKSPGRFLRERSRA